MHRRQGDQVERMLFTHKMFSFLAFRSRSPFQQNNHQQSSNNSRRPSSPQAIPGLPLIEIRRPSALSQFEFGYFVNSPETIGDIASGEVESDCAPLLLNGNALVNSRKSSDESSICEWTSRASSAMSQVLLSFNLLFNDH